MFTPRRLSTMTALVLALAGGTALSTLPASANPFAAVQTTASAINLGDARKILEQHGRFVTHARHGEVWVPAAVAPGWKPYPHCNWVHDQTNGWFYDDKSPWGRIVHHFGRWTQDSQLGWAWVPGDEFSPAWVLWQQQGNHVAWMARPPESDLQLVSTDDLNRSNGWHVVEFAKLGATCGGSAIDAFLKQPVGPRTASLPARTTTRYVDRPVILGSAPPPVVVYDPIPSGPIVVGIPWPNGGHGGGHGKGNGQGGGHGGNPPPPPGGGTGSTPPAPGGGTGSKPPAPGGGSAGTPPPSGGGTGSVPCKYCDKIGEIKMDKPLPSSPSGPKIPGLPGGPVGPDDYKGPFNGKVEKPSQKPGPFTDKLGPFNDKFGQASKKPGPLSGQILTKPGSINTNPGPVIGQTGGGMSQKPGGLGSGQMQTPGGAGKPGGTFKPGSYSQMGGSYAGHLQGNKQMQPMQKPAQMQQQMQMQRATQAPQGPASQAVTSVNSRSISRF